jgi:hypothetical protein
VVALDLSHPPTQQLLQRGVQQWHLPPLAAAQQQQQQGRHRLLLLMLLVLQAVPRLQQGQPGQQEVVQGWQVLSVGRQVWAASRSAQHVAWLQLLVAVWMSILCLACTGALWCGGLLM